MRSRWPIIGISLLFALLTLIPYAAAYASAGDMRFSGFLFNPYDAASYLAKMRQGYDGQYLYTLAFTEDPGPGALIFSFYLFLGHCARLLGLPLIVVWHAARILGGVFFLTAAWEFFGRIGFSPRARAAAWLITGFGSGLGFLAVVFGSFTADLWVAEYIPFLGMFTSAHFPLATALVLLLAMRIALPARRQSPLSLALVFLCGTSLGAIQPFAFLPLGFALAVWAAWMRLTRGRFPDGSLAGISAAAAGILPWILYDFWILRALPAFADWFSQNQTPTPPVWDIALSLGLPGAAVLVSLADRLRIRAPWREQLRSIDEKRFLLIVWFAVNLLLLYAPFSLQRRLMLGMWIPLAALAAPKLEAWVFRPSLSRGRLLAAGVPLLITNLVFLLALLAAGLARNPALFLSRDEAAAADWLNANAGGSVVLAPPELGKWLPGLAGVRVVYGHPMETPDAVRALRDVEAFYQTADPAVRSRILADRRVEYVLCPGDQPSCGASADGLQPQVFSSGAITILRVTPN
ncbi:MAG: hypothetical protein JW929_08935 [Anaerolineales bacterium]|nr:hypothetical protein [Anaerolineales bacterium]